MSAKTSAARRRAFFVALTETGNQTLAAERARVSRSWVTLHRMTDPAFRAEIDTAILAAKARLDAATGVEPARGWRGQGGEELTVRGSRGRWTQVARARLRQWTPRIEARFLRTLEGNCNVKVACAAVGLTQASAYGHRKRWPDFAQAWDRAIENGYDLISIALAQAGGAMLGEGDYRPDPVLGPMSVDQAIAALRLHWRSASRGWGRPGLVARDPTMDEVHAFVLRKIEIMQRAESAQNRRKALRG